MGKVSKSILFFFTLSRGQSVSDKLQQMENRKKTQRQSSSSDLYVHYKKGKYPLIHQSSTVSNASATF